MLHVDNYESVHKYYKWGFRTYIRDDAHCGYAGNIVFYGFDNKEGFLAAINWFERNAIYRYNSVQLISHYGQLHWDSVTGIEKRMRTPKYIEQALKGIEW